MIAIMLSEAKVTRFYGMADDFGQKFASFR